MDSKYRELRGESGFLIHEEASTLLAGRSDEVPTKDEPVELTAEVQTWLKYADEGGKGVQLCEPQPNGIQQHDLSLCFEPQTGVTIAEPVNARSRSRDDDYQSTASIPQMSNGHRKVLDSANARSAGLPNRTGSVRRKPIPGRGAVTMLARTTQTAESSRSPAPSKGRQDSAQTVVPQTTTAQAVAPLSAQVQDRYPLHTEMDRKQDPQ